MRFTTGHGDLDCVAFPAVWATIDPHMVDLGHTIDVLGVVYTTVRGIRLHVEEFDPPTPDPTTQTPPAG